MNFTMPSIFMMSLPPLPPALSDPEVMISPVDTTVTAGDPLTVWCTMTAIPFLAVQPTVELLGPDGSVLPTTNMDLMVGLTLGPVRTSHAGQYTCRASVVIASVSVNVSGRSTSTLTVESESEADIVLYSVYTSRVPYCSPST